jgi:hypothetical protein
MSILSFLNFEINIYLRDYNKSENGINSCENSNITVNNDKPNDNGENIFIPDQEGKDNDI